MEHYCTLCFRELPSELAECRRCGGRRPVSAAAMVGGVSLFALVMTGMLTFNVVLCVTGAVVAAIAIVIGIGRRLRG